MTFSRKVIYFMKDTRIPLDFGCEIWYDLRIDSSKCMLRG